MSDEIDRAQDHMEREEELRRKYHQGSMLEAEATGFCLNCKDPVPRGHRWCDAECRLDWSNRGKSMRQM